ncbi:MAG: tRNA pseudouridine(55) synthase TruB [Bacteroidetes bacterium]|nr:tRNA pseudouridine(55) synthase TruB [Bacteroidota bacterium]
MINFEEGSVILIDKPYRWSSFDVVNKIRSLIKYHIGIKKIKIGHAGTLDPLATGLLILCSGKFTKKIDEFQAFEKEYTGTMVLGATRPSSDMETEIDNTYDISNISEENILELAKTFVGNIQQTPPLFSAKKIEGTRAYEFARKGMDVKMAVNDIFIKEFEITNINLPEISFRIVCSKGTYIRSLVKDFGEKLQNGAYLSALCRTRIGEYYLKNAWSMEKVEEIIIKQKK